MKEECESDQDLLMAESSGAGFLNEVSLLRGLSNGKEFRMTMSNKGRRSLMRDGYMYRLDHSGKDKLSWRCCTRGCPAHLKTDHSAEMIVQDNEKGHTHTVDAHRFEKQMLRIACKRKAVEDCSTPTQDIISNEMTRLCGLNLSPKNTKFLQLAMYRERKKIFPKMPRVARSGRAHKHDRKISIPSDNASGIPSDNATGIPSENAASISESHIPTAGYSQASCANYKPHFDLLTDDTGSDYHHHHPHQQHHDDSPLQPHLQQLHQDLTASTHSHHHQDQATPTHLHCQDSATPTHLHHHQQDSPATPTHLHHHQQDSPATSTHLHHHQQDPPATPTHLHHHQQDPATSIHLHHQDQATPIHLHHQQDPPATSTHLHHQQDLATSTHLRHYQPLHHQHLQPLETTTLPQTVFPSNHLLPGSMVVALTPDRETASSLHFSHCETQTEISYADVKVQEELLLDKVRTLTYRRALQENRARLEGATLLEVGAGTGILGHFALQAGASRVFAVEPTGMAAFADRVAKENGVGSAITVLHTDIETADIPVKVDAIICEWMGHSLLCETMLPSLLTARDRYLRQGGDMYPCTATLYLAPVTDGNFQERLTSWKQMKDLYGVSMESVVALASDALTVRAVRRHLEGEAVLANACQVAHFDLKTMTLKDAQLITADFTFRCYSPNMMHGFATWFLAYFPGSVVLDTSPYALKTHWGQTGLYLTVPVSVQQDSQITGVFMMQPSAGNHRSWDIQIDFQLNRGRKYSQRWQCTQPS